MNLPPSHEFILGEDFMQMAKTKLNCAAGTCILQQGRKGICLKYPADAAQPSFVQAAVHAPKQGVSLGYITPARIRHACHKGCTVFAVTAS